MEEQIFHVWRSFNFDENTEKNRYLCNANKTGSSTLRLWGTTGIGSIQKHVSNKIILDTVSNRRPKTSSETAKRILTKEKLDTQLTGQTSTSPFMNIRDGIDRKLSFMLEKS